MTFHSPDYFWLLLLPFLMQVLRLLARRTPTPHPHPKILHGLATRSAFVPSPRAARLPSSFLLFLAFLFGVTSLARPQWGEIATPVFEPAREIIFAVDVSRSMLAEDIRPNRLARARLLARSLLEQLDGERVGLILFAGTAFVQSPLSADYEILREFLDAMDPSFIPVGGSNYRTLLETALDAFGQSDGDRFLIILGDGEDHSEQWRELLPRLTERRIRIISLGLGTREGGMIPDGQGSFLKDQRGAVILTRLESDTLRALATATDGRYAEASQWVDLPSLVATVVASGRQGDFRQDGRVRRAERFQWPLAATLLCLAAALYREIPLRPRPRRLHPASSLAFLLAAFFLPLPAPAAPTPTPPLASLAQSLASRPDPLRAEDYHAFAQASLDHASALAHSPTPAPPGTIQDGLEATRLGRRLAPRLTDWDALTQALQALLPDPPTPESSPSDGDPSSEDRPPQDGDSSPSSDPNREPSNDSTDPSDSPSDSKDSPSDPSSDSTPSDSHNSASPSSSDSPPHDPAFGDMSEPATPPPPPDSAAPSDPPPPDSRQQVGGQAARPTLDPNQAAASRRLDRIRDADTPGLLFQRMLEQPAAPPERDW